MIENGQITEIGTNDELMQHSGTYQRLYNMQFSDSGMVSAGNGDAVHAAVEGIA